MEGKSNEKTTERAFGDVSVLWYAGRMREEMKTGRSESGSV